MFQKFGSTLPQSLVDAAASISEAKVEPAKPDAEAIARRKRLQALKDKQEDDAAEKSYKQDTGVRKVQGSSYGGAKQKDDEVNEEVEELDEGAYEPSDPKHPKFKANYDRYKKHFPDHGLSHFVSYMKKPNAETNLRMLGKQKTANEDFDIVEFVEAINEMDESQLDEMINEVLGKSAKAGDWIHDFVHSDNPKFAGKSKSQRKKMALAAYYGKQRNEELKGNQHKIDANKNGKVDAHDFKLLRAKKKVDEDTEELDEVSKTQLTNYSVAKGVIGASKYGKHFTDKQAKQSAHRQSKGDTSTDSMFSMKPKKVDENLDEQHTHVVHTMEVGSKEDTKGKSFKISAKDNKDAWQQATKMTDKIKGHYVDKVVPIGEEADLELVLDLTEGKYDDVPFDPDPPKKSAVAGKKGYGPSVARHLARLGLKGAQKKKKDETYMGKAGTTSEEVEIQEASGYDDVSVKVSGHPLHGKKTVKAVQRHADGSLSVTDKKDPYGKVYRVNQDEFEWKKPRKINNEETEIEESRGHKIIAKKLADIDRRSSGVAPDYHDNAQSISDKLKDQPNTDKVEIVTQKDTSASSQKPDMSHMDDKQDLNKKSHGYGNVVHKEETEIDEATRIQDTQGGYNLKKGSKQSAADRKDAASVVKDFRARWRAKGRSTKRYDTNAQMDKETGFAATKEEVEQVDEVSDNFKKSLKQRVASNKSDKYSQMSKTRENIGKGDSDIYKKMSDKQKSMAIEEVELEETPSLDQYIKSMGYDPEHITKDKKVMFSKTNAFKTWATSRNRQESKTPGQDDDNHMSPGATARG